MIWLAILPLWIFEAVVIGVLIFIAIKESNLHTTTYERDGFPLQRNP